jgi:hypothetical protein
MMLFTSATQQQDNERCQQPSLEGPSHCSPLGMHLRLIFALCYGRSLTPGSRATYSPNDVSITRIF